MLTVECKKYCLGTTGRHPSIFCIPRSQRYSKPSSIDTHKLKSGYSDVVLTPNANWTLQGKWRGKEIDAISSIRKISQVRKLPNLSLSRWSLHILIDTAKA
jgi:hypothetical protein